MPSSPLSSRPQLPHVVCKDGCFWALGRTTRGPFPCRTVEVRSLSVQQVQATYEGDAQSRAEQLAALTPGERAALYPSSCSCGQNHWTAAANLVRAWSQIDEGVRPACSGLSTKSYLAIGAIRHTDPLEAARAQGLAASAAAANGAPGIPGERPPRSNRLRA